MGRSVSTPRDALVVAYAEINDAEYEDYSVFEEINDFRERVIALFPTAYAVDRWLGNEDHALAANAYAYFGMSTYGGIAAYWIVAKEGQEARAQAWLYRNALADKFVGAFGTLTKTGTMSNGEAVYRRK
jgi:hypothetical protein